MSLRYAVAACQTDLANPLDRASMRSNTDRIVPVCGTRRLPPADAASGGAAALSYERNCARIDEVKRSLTTDTARG